MSRVFISYVHEDEAVAREVQKLLSFELKLHTEVFMTGDPTQLLAGMDWFRKIEAELHRCEVVVSMLSRRSVKRPWVNFEAGAAWIQGKPVIPVCYGNQTKGTLPKPYSDLHGLDLADGEHFLVESVARHLGLGMSQTTQRLLGLVKDAPAVAAVLPILTPNVRYVLANFSDET